MHAQFRKESLTSTNKVYPMEISSKRQVYNDQFCACTHH